MSCTRLLAIGLVLFVCAGCAVSPRFATGTPLEKLDATRGYRASSVLSNRPDDGMLVMLSFSGGGARASAMAYGVLEQLSRDGWPADTSAPAGMSRLLETVDVVSGVSGGAVPAAYYVWQGERIFEDFLQRYLYRDLGVSLRKQFVFSPKNWWRLAGSGFTRADLYTEFFAERLFADAAYRDLDQTGRRPFLIINATDIGAGTRFEFTQDEFDRLCVDLGNWSISRAVAASSAVPALITPVTVRNHAGRCGYKLPEWVAAAAAEPEHSTRRYHLAIARQLRADGARYGHVHLVDGALSDNLGVGAILDALLDPNAGRMTRAIPTKLVILMVNAGDSQAERIGGNAEPPGFFDMLRLMGTVPVDRYTAESKAVLREQLSARLSQSQKDALYFIEVDLSSLRQEAERAHLTRLPTTFSLTRHEVDALREAAADLLRKAPEYQRWLQDIGAQSEAFTR
jgi:NTE family protein